MRSTSDGLDSTQDPPGGCHTVCCLQRASRPALDDRAALTRMRVRAGKQQKAKRTTKGDQLSNSPGLHADFLTFGQVQVWGPGRVLLSFLMAAHGSFSVLYAGAVAGVGGGVPIKLRRKWSSWSKPRHLITT